MNQSHFPDSCNQEQVQTSVLANLKKKGFTNAPAITLAWEQTNVEARIAGEHTQKFNEQIRLRTDRSFEYLLLATPNDELPPLYRYEATLKKKKLPQSSDRSALPPPPPVDTQPLPLGVSWRDVPRRRQADARELITASGSTTSAAPPANANLWVGPRGWWVKVKRGPDHVPVARARALETLGVSLPALRKSLLELRQEEAMTMQAIYDGEGVATGSDYSWLRVPVRLRGGGGLWRSLGVNVPGGSESGGIGGVDGSGDKKGGRGRGGRDLRRPTTYSGDQSLTLLITMYFDKDCLYPFTAPSGFSVSLQDPKQPQKELDWRELPLLLVAALSHQLELASLRLSLGGHVFAHDLVQAVQDCASGWIRDAIIRAEEVRDRLAQGLEILPDSWEEVLDRPETPPPAPPLPPIALKPPPTTAVAPTPPTPPTCPATTDNPPIRKDLATISLEGGESALSQLDSSELESHEERDRKTQANRERAQLRAENQWQTWLRTKAAHASSRLRDALTRWEAAPGGKESDMRRQRQRLPAWEHRESIASAVRDNQVVIVAGETGCGKTTQVPQFILDDATRRGKGGEVNIVCTQPRRISATSVATRVAAERCESIGVTVGYQIRLESRSSESTRLLFCTTGVLLRKLLENPTLAGVTHIIVDEVHERSLDSDFLLVLVRDVLPRRRDLRLVLMSATLNAGKFTDYFGKAPSFTIPGFTYPVEEFYLEDVIERLKYKPKDREVYKGMGRQKSSPVVGRVAVGQLFEQERAEEEAYAALGRTRRYSSDTIRLLTMLDQAKVNVELCAELVEHLCLTQPPGGILVFMPGLMEITGLHDTLKASRTIREATEGGRWLIGLHSALSTAQQSEVFERPKEGGRKIVIATNIAETSITIDDVVYVVDLGRVKENAYNPDTHMQCLVESWCSRASARQRRGRAGRVQAGVCFRLYSRFVHDHIFIDFQLPEMLRVPLEGLCLQIKLLALTGGVEGFLSRALDAPQASAISAAVRSLRDIGALDARDHLTALGQHLAALPVDARLGKMLIYGCLLGCLDPVLTVAATMSSRSPFLAPLEQRQAADEAKKQFVPKGERSDHLAVVCAYEAWVEARKGGRGSEREFCWTHFLSGKSLEGIADLRQQFRTLLGDAGFLGYRGGGGGGGATGAVVEATGRTTSTRGRTSTGTRTTLP